MLWCDRRSVLLFSLFLAFGALDELFSSQRSLKKIQFNSASVSGVILIERMLVFKLIRYMSKECQQPQ